MGTLFIDAGDICFETGLLITMAKDLYISITILSKTVNLHCKYLKLSTHLRKLYTFISYICSFQCVFDENCHALFWYIFHFLLAVGDMLEHKCFQHPGFGLFGGQY